MSFDGVSREIVYSLLTHSNRAQSTGGHATEESDAQKGKEKAKKEFPEAPDTAIGFQDERGGKGH